MEKRILSVYRFSVVLFAGMIVLQVFLSGLSIFHQTDIRGVESNVLHTVQRVMVANNLLYSNPSIRPYDINQYSPLYFILSDALVTLLGMQADQPLHIRYAMRSISLFFLWMALFTFHRYLIKRMGYDWKQALLFPAFLLIANYPWDFLARPDVLQLYFISAALYVRAGSFESKHWNSFWVGVLLALAIASKFNALFFLPAFACYDLFNKNFKSLAKLILGSLIGLLVFALVLHLLGYYSPYYFDNLFGGINNGLTLQAWFKSVTHFLLRHMLWVSLSVVLSYVFIGSFSNEHKKQFKLLAVVSSVLFLMNVVGVAKVGAGENYFIEAYSVLLLLAALVLKKMEAVKRKLFLTAYILLGLQLGLLNLTSYGYDLFRKQDKGGALLSQQYWKEIDSVKTFVLPQLKGDYFFSFNRELNLAMPNQCTVFASDVHDLSFQRKLISYSDFQKMANEGILKFVIVTDTLKSAYGVNFAHQFVFSKNIGRFRLFQNKQSF